MKTKGGAPDINSALAIIIEGTDWGYVGGKRGGDRFIEWFLIREKTKKDRIG